MSNPGFKIWIDNDACPRQIREVVFKAAKREQIPVKLVANQVMRTPPGVDAEIICVPTGFDAADDRIVESLNAEDLVITSDVPLADRAVTEGAVALSPRGQPFTEANIKELRALRDLRQELRSAGDITGGPKEFSAADVKRFAAAFDRIVTQKTRGA